MLLLLRRNCKESIQGFWGFCLFWVGVTLFWGQVRHEERSISFFHYKSFPRIENYLWNKILFFFLINLHFISSKHFLSAHQSAWAVKQAWLVLFQVKPFVTAIKLFLTFGFSVLMVVVMHIDRDQKCSER